MVSDVEKDTVLRAVLAASRKWQNAFNSGNAQGCADQYEAEAVMEAVPFGTFTGPHEIFAFWQKLIEDGFADVEYLEPAIEVIDAKRAILKSGWKMNRAHGVIHKELWVLQPDGTARLREDHFEALG